MAETQKRIVVVLGMHRSGTSAIARGLQVLGVELGERLMPAAVGNNDRGFYEDVDANALNRELLQAMGREWDSLEPVTGADLARPEVEPFRLRAVELLRERLSRWPVYGLKDPRISVLLPFWQQAFEHVGASADYVLCSRNPLSVARSLERRDGIPPEKSFYLWLEHVAAAWLLTRDGRRIVVSYDRMMQEPEKELRRIGAALDLGFNAPEMGSFVEFLSEDLRHSRFGLADLRLEPRAAPELVEAYERLESLAADEASADADRFFEQVSARLVEMRVPLGFMGRMETRVRDLLDEAREAEERYHALDRVRAEREGQVGDLTEMVIAKDRDIAALQHAVAVKDGLIHGLNVTLATKEEVIGQLRDVEARAQELASAVAQKDHDIAGLQKAIVAKDGQIQGLNIAVAAAMRQAAETLCASSEPELVRLSAGFAEGAHDRDAEASNTLEVASASHAALLSRLAMLACDLSLARRRADEERELVRLRLVDAIRHASHLRDQLSAAAAHAAALEQRLAVQTAALSERDRVLGQFGHQFVTRLGSLLDPYPAVRWVITAPLRFIHWALGHARA